MTQEVKILIGIGVATLLVIVGAVFFLSSSSPSQEISQETIEENKEVLVREDSQRIGSDSASVVLVEFADFQCPACRASHPVISQILSEYPEDVLFVYRHFPLPMHGNAKSAAYAAEAAGRQGKFWEMHDMLFEGQDAWAEADDPSSIFASYASDLELDLDKFSEDMMLEEVSDKVNRDLQDGTMLGVGATPTFFLNGAPAFQGVPNYQDLKALIDQHLSD